MKQRGNKKIRNSCCDFFLESMRLDDAQLK
jgi:hypothetical protein